MMAISQTHQSNLCCWQPNEIYLRRATRFVRAPSCALIARGSKRQHPWREATNAQQVMTNDQGQAQGCNTASLFLNSHTHGHVKALQGNKHKIAYTTCCSSIKNRTSACRGGTPEPTVKISLEILQ